MLELLAELLWHFTEIPFKNMPHTYYIADGTENHVGKDTWNRLSKNQKNIIRKDRKNASKHAAAFIREKNAKFGWPKNS
jgi:TRAP-type C4-dicarboxylate transport system substrate-binding protein